MKFQVQAAATAGANSLWTAQTEHLSPITCAIPPEFMGPGGGYSPEDLFALSLISCLIATYKVYCEKSNVNFTQITGKATLTVDKVAGESGFALTQADIFIDVTGADNVERARKLLDTAIRDCAVSNSIKTGKAFHINVS